MKVTVLLLAVSLAVCPLFATDSALDRYIEARMKEDRIPGLVVGYFNGDETVVRAFGSADLENATPMKADSSFRLASITKTLTAVAVLQLAESGKMNLDAEVQTYVPYFPRKPWPVTIRQLLGHLGGISHYRNRAFEQHIKERKTIRETVAIFENFDLVAEPGTRYSYSTYGYGLLAAAIEGASGQTYAAYMRDHIFTPLGMSATREDDPLAIIPNRVRGYQRAEGEVVNSEFIDISTRVGGGGTRSTVPDLLRFLRGLMEGRLLSKASMELMFTTMQTRGGELTDYAMGCTMLPLPGYLDTNGRFAVTNNGAQQETRTFMMFFPGRNAAFATAMNFELNTDDSLLQRIAQTLFGEPLDFAPVSSDGKDDATLRAMQQVFTLGVADREAHPSRRADDAEVAKALAYFAGVVEGRTEADAIAKGRQPFAGEPFTILGHAMADALSADASTPARGAIGFFADVARLQRFALPASLTARLARWEADWNVATPPSVRRLVIAPDADFAAIGKQLRSTFAGRSVRPDFAKRFAAAVERLLTAGDTMRAAEAAALGAELYPASGASQFALALTTLAVGRHADAKRLVARAEELDASPEQADVDRLNGTAYLLARANRVADGVALLRIATEIHPRESNLFDSLGELTLLAGDRAAARAAYRKALELDPSATNAEEMLKKLQ